MSVVQQLVAPQEGGSVTTVGRSYEHLHLTAPGSPSASLGLSPGEGGMGAAGFGPKGTGS